MANLEHEPVGPLVLSAFVGPGDFLIWPVLIALAVFGANQALGNARTALICVAGQVIGTLVSEGIVAYRVQAGQLPAADKYLTDVGPSYVVVSAIVIAVVCGTWLARAAAALDFAVLVFGGHIFSDLSHLDVSAVGHLTALVTAAAGVTLILARGGRPERAAEGQARHDRRGWAADVAADKLEVGCKSRTYALRGARAPAVHALAAPIARVTARMALAALGLSGDPVHVRGLASPPSCYRA